jgi:predicted esterase
MRTWTLSVAGLTRTVLVQGEETARFGFVMHHGHGMTAEKILDSFTPNSDFVVFAPQGLVASDGATSFMSPRSISKYPGSDGTEDFQLDERIILKALKNFPLLTRERIGCGGFSGGMGYTRESMIHQPDAFGFYGGGWNTMHEDEVGSDGAFVGLLDKKPFQLWLGKNDDVTARVPPKLDYEPTIAAYAKRYGATQKSKRTITVCGISVEQRTYSHPNLQVFLPNGGHSITKCTTDGFDNRLYLFAKARSGL